MKKLYFLLFTISFLAILHSYAGSHINSHVDAPNPALTILGLLKRVVIHHTIPLIKNCLFFVLNSFQKIVYT